MEYKKILEFFAPCGLSCRKCFAFTKGDIARHDQHAFFLALEPEVFGNTPDLCKKGAYFHKRLK